MDIKTLKAIIKLAKKEGLKSFTMGDIHFEFSPDALIPKKRQSKLEATKVDETLVPQYSDMDTLLWSVQGVELNEAN